MNASPMLGLQILDGSTRVRTSANGLVKLEDIAGDPTDLSNYFTQSEVTNQLLFKQHIIASTPGSASTLQIWDDTSNAVRRLVAGSNVTLTQDETTTSYLQPVVDLAAFLAL